MLITTLQVLVGVIFFAHKVLILKGEKGGWLLGAAGAVLATAYFYLLDLYVYTVLEISLVALLGYGFFKKDGQTQVEVWIRGITIATMVLLAIFAFNGFITIVELLSATGLVVGTYLLTHDRPRLGWGTYIVAHTLAAYLGYHKEQFFFADLQIASAIVSLIGAMKTSRTASP